MLHTSGIEAEEHRTPARDGRSLAVEGSPHGRATHRPHFLRKWAIVVLGAFAIGLFPWTLYLTYELPERHFTAHWDVAWAGLDVFEAIAAALTVWALLRGSRRLAMIAAVTGTFLVCDAWFDVVTARRGSELAWSVGEAVLAELPLAALCFWLANDAERLCARTQDYLEARRERRGSRGPG